MELEFDADSDGLIVHMPDNPDGVHEHAEKATYVLLEQAAEGVGVSVRWTLHGHVHEMKGSVKGDKLQLNSEDGVLEFERGHSAAH